MILCEALKEMSYFFFQVSQIFLDIAVHIYLVFTSQGSAGKQATDIKPYVQRHSDPIIFIL